MFYDVTKTLRYGAIYNMVISPRNMGKTYSTLKWAVNKALRTKERFCWLVRHVTEFEIARKGLFKPFERNKEYKGTFEIIEGKNLCDIIYTDENGEKHAIGIIAAISRYTVYKKAPLFDIFCMIFDEFILENRRYYKGEAQFIQNIRESFNRVNAQGDEEKLLPVIALGNNFSLTNPMFDYWGMTPIRGKEFTLGNTNMNSDCLIHDFIDHELLEKRKNSRSGKANEGTTYGDFALYGNKFKDWDKIGRCKTAHDFCANVTGNGRAWGIWYSQEEDIYFVSDNIKKNEFIYSLVDAIGTFRKWRNYPLFANYLQLDRVVFLTPLAKSDIYAFYGDFI